MTENSRVAIITGAFTVVVALIGLFGVYLTLRDVPDTEPPSPTTTSTAETQTASTSNEESPESSDTTDAPPPTDGQEDEPGPENGSDHSLVFYGELTTGNDGKLQIYQLTDNYTLGDLIIEHDYPNWRSVGGLTLHNGEPALVFYGELTTGNDGKLQIYQLTDNYTLGDLIIEHDYPNWRSVGGLTLHNGEPALVFYGELTTGNDGKLQIYQLTDNYTLGDLIIEHDYPNWRSVGGLTLHNGEPALVFYGELTTGNDGKLQIYQLTDNYTLGDLIIEHDYPKRRSVGGGS